MSRDRKPATSIATSWPRAIFCGIHLVLSTLTLLTAADRLTSASAASSIADEYDCDADVCDGMLCPYGRAYDSAGCPVCDCLYPCQDVVCEAEQQCIAVRIHGCDGITCPQYTGFCTATSSATKSVTSSTCPSVDCTSISCPLRLYMVDANGCQTCQCADPCASLGILCTSGFVCRASTDDCLPGEECRDVQMPYCAPDVSTTPAVIQTSERLENASSISTTTKPALRTSKTRSDLPTKKTTSATRQWLAKSRFSAEVSSTTRATMTSTISSDEPATSDEIRAIGVLHVEEDCTSDRSLLDLKHQIQLKIANQLRVPSEFVSVTEIDSVTVQFAALLPSSNYTRKAEKTLTRWLTNVVDLPVNGKTCAFSVTNFTFVRNDPYKLGTPTSTVVGDLIDTYDFLLLVILVCLTGPVILVAIACVVMLICKRYYGRQLLPHVRRRRSWMIISRQGSVVSSNHTSTSSKLEDFEKTVEQRNVCLQPAPAASQYSSKYEQNLMPL